MDEANGYRPLHWAARTGHVEVVTLLISMKASLAVKERAGNTPLHLAAMNGHVGVMKALLAAKANKDALNDVRIAKLVLRDCLLMSESQLGHTPLHLALINKKTAAARLLAEQKAGLEIRDQVVRAVPQFVHFVCPLGH